MENFSKNMMFAEICAQPGFFGHLVRKYINGAKILMDFPLNFSEIKFVASGSSYNCARLGQKFFENVAKINNLKQVFASDMGTIERTIDTALQVNMRDILVSKVSQMIKNKTLVDINIIRLLSKRLSYDFEEILEQ